MSKKGKFKHNLRELVKDDMHKTIARKRWSSRRVSDKTIADRWHLLWRLVDIIYAAGYKVEKPQNLDERHLQAVFDHWDRKDLMAHTIQTYLPFLRYLVQRAARGHLLKEIDAYSERIVQREREKMQRKAEDTEDKRHGRSCLAQNVDYCEVIENVIAKDSLVALQLVLIRHFGLRVREVHRLRPSESIKGDELHILRGAKGGRRRVIPILDREGEQLLEHARRVARTLGGTMMPESYAEKSWRSYFYGVLRSVGMTKSVLGVTPHGLRHEYAQVLYATMTGVAAPVLANGNRAREGDAGRIDLEARQQIASRLGHGRYDITRFYLDWVDQKRTLHYRSTRRQRGSRANQSKAA